MGMERFARVVVGAVIQLGRCFDLMNEAFTRLLAEAHRLEKEQSQAEGRELPRNTGGTEDLKARKLDCHIINFCVQQLAPEFQTVRGAFWEGGRVYPEAMIYTESHIQVAVRDRDCILGVFRPNLRT